MEQSENISGSHLARIFPSSCLILAVSCGTESENPGMIPASRREEGDLRKENCKEQGRNK